MAGLEYMSTERSSPRYSSIDVWDAEDIADSIVESQFAAVAAVQAARNEIAAAAVAMHARLQDCGRLIYVGAGTSGRLAVQDGAELAPTFGWSEERLVLLIAGGEKALLRSLEGADHPIFLDTGSEPITGSTRLKAGTAQKVALNTLSTSLMILLGKVYRG